MKVLLAPDKFKGSFTAFEVGELLAKGLRQELPKAIVVQKPMVDGGEGTAEAIAPLFSMDVRHVALQNVAGQEVLVPIYWLGEKRVVLIESSHVLKTDLPWTESDFMRSSSWPLGKLIQKALELRPKELWITAGGTLTSDLGWGVASCFGVTFLDAAGNRLEPAMKNLALARQVEFKDFNPVLTGTRITLLCDVNAPLVSPGGTSLRSFLRQKGALESSEDSLMCALENTAQLLNSVAVLQLDKSEPFSGAAGGLLFGLRSFHREVESISGSQFYLKLAAMRSVLAGCNLVVCGEGKLDETTLYGKSVFAIAQLARELHIPTVGVFGQIEDLELKKKLGFKETFTLCEDIDRKIWVKQGRIELESIGRKIAKLAAELEKRIKNSI